MLGYFSFSSVGCKQISSDPRTQHAQATPAKEILLCWERGEKINRISQISSSNWFSAITHLCISAKERMAQGSGGSSQENTFRERDAFNQTREEGGCAKHSLPRLQSGKSPSALALPH